MINREILSLLKNKMGLSIPSLYAKIEKKRTEIGYGYSTEVAAYVVAAEMHIDISKHLSAEELAAVREAMRVRVAYPLGQRRAKVEKQVVMTFEKDFQIHCPVVPEAVLNDAKKMQRVYPYFYIFENSIRYFIKDTLQSKYGDDWWLRAVNPGIRKDVDRRQAKEGRNRWHGGRGEHPIFYTDIDHLRKIITSNFDDFKDKLPDVDRPVEWLTNRIEEIELSRNIVAHHNPLSDDDIARVKMYFREWIKQISNL